MNQHPSIPILHRLLKPLCELPYDLVEHTSGTSSVITLTLEYSDVGKILGRDNIIRESLKTIVEAIGQGCGIAAKLELDYPTHGKKLPRTKPKPDPHFIQADIVDLVCDILDLTDDKDAYNINVAAGSAMFIDIIPVVDMKPELVPAIHTVVSAWAAARGRSGVVVKIPMAIQRTS